MIELGGRGALCSGSYIHLWLRRERGTRPRHPGRPVLRGSPVCTAGTARVYHPFPEISNCRGREGGQEGTDAKDSEGTLQGPLAIQFMVSPRQPRSRSRAGRKGGRRGNREGGQAAAASGHVATSVFCLLKYPPRTTPRPCPRLLDTKFQDPAKTQSASSSFWGRGRVMGVSASLEAGAGGGQTGQVSLGTLKPLA